MFFIVQNLRRMQAFLVLMCPVYRESLINWICVPFVWNSVFVYIYFFYSRNNTKNKFNFFLYAGITTTSAVMFFASLVGIGQLSGEAECRDSNDLEPAEDVMMVVFVCVYHWLFDVLMVRRPGVAAFTAVASLFVVVATIASILYLRVNTVHAVTAGAAYGVLGATLANRALLYVCAHPENAQIARYIQYVTSAADAITSAPSHP